MTPFLRKNLAADIRIPPIPVQLTLTILKYNLRSLLKSPGYCQDLIPPCQLHFRRCAGNCQVLQAEVEN
jgi:hypothetical protein